MRSRHAAVAVGLAGLLAGGAVRAQTPPPPPPNPGDPPPALSAPPPDPLVIPLPEPEPKKKQPETPKPRPRWVLPVTIVLAAGAVGFAAASIAVISTGPTSDQGRVDLAGGLGGGFIACAAAGVAIGLAVH